MAARAPKKAGMSEETKKNIREGIVAVLIAFVVMGACSLLFIGHQNAPVPQPETANAVVAAATVNGPTFLEKAASILAVGVFFVSVLIFLPLCVFRRRLPVRLDIRPHRRLRRRRRDGR